MNADAAKSRYSSIITRLPSLMIEDLSHQKRDENVLIHFSVTKPNHHAFNAQRAAGHAPDIETSWI